MSIKELKTKLTAFFAEKLGLTVDETIFQNPLDGDQNNALGLIVESFPTSNRPKIDSVNIQLLGRYQEYDNALELSSKFNNFLPYYSSEFNILFTSNAVVYPTTILGKRVQAVSVNLKVAFK